MKRKELICIVCPNGCRLEVTYNEGEPNSIDVKGALCPKGKEYAKNEIFSPQRTITSSIKVEDGEIPLVSVKTTVPIPKNKIFDAMEVVKKSRVKAPVKLGDVLIRNICGTGADIIATKTVEKAE